MPAETIYSAGDIDVRVAWGSEFTQTLQVATQVARKEDYDPTQRVISIVNEWLVAAGDQPIDLVELAKKMRANGYPAPFFDGYTAQLSDWSQVNTLIKVLRRARDRVFGEAA